MRNDFEQHMKVMFPNLSLERSGDDYRDDRVTVAWIMWQVK